MDPCDEYHNDSCLLQFLPFAGLKLKRAAKGLHCIPAVQPAPCLLMSSRLYEEMAVDREELGQTAAHCSGAQRGIGAHVLLIVCLPQSNVDGKL